MSTRKPLTAEAAERRRDEPVAGPSMWSAELERIEADRRGVSRDALVAEACERHRKALERAGMAGMEPATRGGR